MKKRAAIFLNGTFDAKIDLPSYIFDDTLIIGADGGAKHIFNNGHIPDVVIGDMDSLPKKYISQISNSSIKLIRYPKDKDYADGELSIQYALQQGIEDVVIFAFKGTRIDHMLSNILFIGSLSQKAKFILVDGDEEMHFVSEKINLKGKIGDDVSLIPIIGNCKSITTTGLQYPLHKETLLLGSTRGISNVMTENNFSIELVSGTLLVIHTRKIMRL